MDAKHFLYSSDYQMPALVWSDYGSLTAIPAYGTKSVTMTHNLPFVPLLLGVWSENSDFNPAYDISNFIGPADINGNLELNACGANSLNVLVEAYNGANTPKTLYFKLIAFAPPDYDGDLPNIYDTTNFMFNTDYNYPKIVKSGVVTLNSGSSTTINHNLGYVPQAKVWGADQNGRITPLYRKNMSPSLGGDDGPLIDKNNLVIKAGSSGKYYYHIYGDSADVDS